MARCESSPNAAVSLIADDLGLSPKRVRAVLQFLAKEGYVELNSGCAKLTRRGAQLEKITPWYFLLVGGYAKTFSQIGEVLRSPSTYASRDGASVGIGSCGISQYDALPMTRALLRKIDGEVRTIVDLGCGDGSYLFDLCSPLSALRGIGFDPEPASVALANKAAEQRGIEDRVSVHVGSALALPVSLAGGWTLLLYHRLRAAGTPRTSQPRSDCGFVARHLPTSSFFALDRRRGRQSMGRRRHDVHTTGPRVLQLLLSHSRINRTTLGISQLLEADFC